jgi:flagellar motor switch protein FliM
MSAPLLTHEELAALREGMQSSSMASVEDVELTGVDRVLRKHAPTLDRRLLKFADGAQATLGRALRAGCRLVNRPFELVGPRAAIDIMPRFVVCVAVQNRDGVRLGVLALDPILTFAVIERAFGATLVKADAEGGWQVERTQLTEIEQRTLAPTIDELMKALAAAVAQTNAPSNPTFTGVIDASARELPQDLETMVLWRASVDYGIDRGELALLLFPVATEVFAGRTAPARTERPEWLTQHVVRMDVEISAELGRATLSVAELVALRPGDVLKLDRRQSDVVPVRVGGCARFVGRPSQQNGAYAVEIEAETT